MQEHNSGLLLGERNDLAQLSLLLKYKYYRTPTLLSGKAAQEGLTI